MITTFASCALLAFGVVHGQVLHNVTVDDTDSVITYKGTWNKSTGITDAYQGTFQSTSEAGASATLTFTGVGVYYFMPLFENITGGVSTLLSLDSGPAQLVNLTRVADEPTRVAVRWSATGLSNGKHTLVSSPGRSSGGAVAGWGEVDGFIYTKSDSEIISTTVSCDDPQIIYSPRGVWSTNSTNLPSCAVSHFGVRTSSTPNATFTYDFTSDTVFVRTINSPKGGNISLSVNGGPPQIYNTYAASTGCGTSQVQKVSAVKLSRRAQTYNTLTVKTVDGETRVDGVTDGQSRRSAAHRTTFMDIKFCVGAILSISYLVSSGIL